jgi:hypothetical protein
MATVVTWNDVPMDADGQPLLVARSKRSYDHYLKWLADYLYRPSKADLKKSPLSIDAAWGLVIVIEIEIASWIWDHPFDDYPPGERKVGHVDFLHRKELSEILSRVPSHSDRLEVLDRFYGELARDAAK